MKRILVAVFSIMILMGMATTTLAQSFKEEVVIDGKTMSLSKVTVNLDGKNIEEDVPSVIYNAKTLVPIRLISESLGAKVGWDSESQSSTIETSDKVIVIAIDSSKIIVNGKAQNIPDNVPAKLMLTSKSNGARTMVPLRFVSEVLGAEVGWDSATNTAIVKSKKNNAAPNVKPVEPTKPVEPAVKVNKIKSIEKQVINGKEAIVIKNEFQPKVKSFSLSNPDRWVLDLRDTDFNNASSQLKTDIAKGVRTSQYTGSEYDSKEQVARVVLDISDDYEKHKVKMENKGNDIIIYVEGTKKAPVITLPSPPEVKPPTPPTPPVVVPPVVTPPTPPVTQPTAKKLVAIDAGHGGSDSGASKNGLIEKQLALKVALKVEEKLKNLGHDVIMTRRSDVRLAEDTSTDLRRRAEVANNNNADVFLSIHFNSATATSATGIETFYTPKEGQNRSGFAQSIQSELINSLGVVDRKVKTANFAVTRQTNMVSALAELGFISNPNDAKRIVTEEYLEKCATALAHGIHKFLSK